MDKNMNVNQDTVSGSIKPESKTLVPEKSSNGQKKFLILGGLLLLVFLGTSLYYLSTRSNQLLIKKDDVSISSKPTSQLNSSNRSSGTETVSIDGKSSTYINHDLGFSIKYPSYNRSPSTCIEKESDVNGAVPLKVFEVPNQNSLYISEANYISVKNKESMGGYVHDFSTCTVMQNTLDLIQNGIDNGIVDKMNKDNSISKPNALKFNYQKINNDDDLQKLAQSMYKSCYVGEKQFLDNSEGVYQIKLVDKDGKIGSMDSGCFPNFIYFFQYSPKNHVAVISSGFQNPPFNGTNNKYEPEIEFVK